MVLPGSACKEFVSLMQKAFQGFLHSHLVLYPVKPNPSTQCKRQRSIDSSTSNFAPPSPELPSWRQWLWKLLVPSSVPVVASGCKRWGEERGDAPPVSMTTQAWSR